MIDFLLWGACVAGWLFDAFLVASQAMSGGVL